MKIWAAVAPKEWGSWTPGSSAGTNAVSEMSVVYSSAEITSVRWPWSPLASVTGVDLEGIGVQLSLEELKRYVGRLTREGGEDRNLKPL